MDILVNEMELFKNKILEFQKKFDNQENEIELLKNEIIEIKKKLGNQENKFSKCENEIIVFAYNYINNKSLIFLKNATIIDVSDTHYIWSDTPNQINNFNKLTCLKTMTIISTPICNNENLPNAMFTCNCVELYLPSVENLIIVYTDLTCQPESLSSLPNLKKITFVCKYINTKRKSNFFSFGVEQIPSLKMLNYCNHNNIKFEIL